MVEFLEMLLDATNLKFRWPEKRWKSWTWLWRPHVEQESKMKNTVLLQNIVISALLELTFYHTHTSGTQRNQPVHIKDRTEKFMKRNIRFPFCFLLCKHVCRHYGCLPLLHQQPVFRMQKEFILTKEYRLQPIFSNPEIQQRLPGPVLRTWVTTMYLFYKTGLKC